MKYLRWLIVLVMALLCSAIATGSLGEYTPNDLVTYSVVCVSDAGFKDNGCSNPDDDILGPGDIVAKSPTKALAEVSDANFPGLWRGNYTIPSDAEIGTWSIYVELTNSNSTLAATVLNFNVNNFDSDDVYSDMGSNFTTTQTSIIGNNVDIGSNFTSLRIDMGANFTSVEERFDGVDANLTQMYADAGANFTNLEGRFTNVDINLTGINSNLTVLLDNVTSSTYGLSAIKTYLVDTIYDYLVNTIQDFLLNTLSLDIGSNFTATTSQIEELSADVGANFTATEGRFDTIDSSIGDINNTLLELSDDVGANFTNVSTRLDIVDDSIGDVNNTLLELSGDAGANFTFVNERFDDVNTNITNATTAIIGHGDDNWAGNITGLALSDEQNQTLFAIFDNQGTNFTNVESRFDSVDTNISNMNISLYNEIIATPERVWNSSWAPERVLTSYPVGVIASVDLNEEGFYNSTFYNSEVGHVIGSITPENTQSLQSGRWAQNHLLIENLPVNITQAKVCFWLKKTGNPTGNLGVYMNDSFLYNLSAADFTTNLAKNCTSVATNNITSYNPITLRGDIGWNPANRIDTGMNEQVSIYSYLSTDSGVTWAHTAQELIFWIETTSFTTSIADQINAKVVNVETHSPFNPCIGSLVNFHWAFYDFKGNQMAINSVPDSCSVYYYEMNGSEINITDANVLTAIENSYISWAIWNNTGDALLNTSYHIDCNGIEVTPPQGVATLVDVDALFGFTEECEAEERFSSIDANLSSLTIEMGSNFTKVGTRFDAIDANLTDATFGLEAIKTYLVDTVYDYMVNTMFDFLLNTLSSDNGANFTATNTMIEGLSGDVGSNFTEVNHKLDNITANFTDVTDRFDTIDTNLGEVNNTLLELSGDVGSNFTEVSSRIDMVDESVADVNNTLLELSGDVGANFTVVDSRLNVVDSNLGELNNTVIEIGEDIGANFTYINGTTLSKVQQEIEATNTSISGYVEDRLDVVDGSLSAVNANLTHNTYGLSAIRTYLSGTIYDYLVNTIQYYLVNTIYDYLVNTIYPSVDETEILVISINETISNLILNVTANVTAVYEQTVHNWELMTNTSLDSSIIKYMNQQNVTEMFYYNNTWYLDNQTFNYSDGVSKRLTFAYNSDDLISTVSEVSY